MLKIGFVRLGDAAASADVERLRAAGCQVVRMAEPGQEQATLRAIFEFIGPDDELLVVRLDRLATSLHGLTEALDRLSVRGAHLSVLEPKISTCDGHNAPLRTVLDALTGLTATAAARPRRGAADASAIHSLARSGLGPVEIARRLGVSRMTVWRKLKSVQTQA
jgi:DNA invertase Pin-like site-specific DNA recombinase